MPPNLGVFLIGNQHYFKRVKSPGVFLKHMAVIWLIQSLSPYLAKLHLSFCVWVHLCHDVGSVLLLLSAYAHSPVGRSTKNLLDLTDFFFNYTEYDFLFTVFLFSNVMFWVLFEGLILFTYLWSFKQQQRKNLNKCCSMKPQQVKEPLTPLDTQLCGSMTSLLQRTTTEMLETPSREFQTEPCGHESSLIWSLQTVLPFCCCIRDWFTAGWGTMVGGGGSAAWLCWLGRARVVPTEAAEEHTIQCNCSSQNIKKAVHPNYTKLNPNSQEKCSQWPS